MFKDRGTADILAGVGSKSARKTCPSSLHQSARRKLVILVNTTALSNLGALPGNQLEALRGNRVGQHSIRVNDQFRICFVWTEQGATDIEIVDYH